MVEYNLKAIHVKALLTALVFCAFNGFYEALVSTLPSFLLDSGYTMVEIGVINYILNGIVFILDSALLFVILYSICRRNFMENISNIIISLIIGTVAGYWIGGLLGLLMSPSRFPTSPSIFTISILLSEFGACSAAYLNTKWNHLIPRTSMLSERPFGVILISALYTVLSLLSTTLTFALLGLYTIELGILFEKTLLFTVLVALLSVLSLAYLFIAYGFYRGRRWAWFAIFALTFIGIFQSINQLILMFYFDVFFILRILVLLLDIFIFFYILQPRIRIYFGIINPVSEN